MKQLILLAAFFIAVPALAQTWHLLNPSAAQRHSAAYKFLVSKFGAKGIEWKCDPDLAAALGNGYLYTVEQAGSPFAGKGTAEGHGATLNDAILSAQGNYIDPAEVKRLQRIIDSRERELKQRERAERKKCGC